MPVISRVAAVQMNSQDHVEENLAMALRWIEKATQEGASWVLLPECFAYMGSEDGKRKIAEPLGEGPIQSFLAQTAAQYKIWLLGGSVPTQATAPSKSRNTSLLYDPNGHLVAVYHKIHLFRYAAERRYAEDETTEAGQDIVTFKAPFGSIGLSICYDVRFPELYRKMAMVDFITVPSAFTTTTGKAHWEILLRARAIENQCFVIAPAQTGIHHGRRETYGHTMMIDPWGNILAIQEKDPGVVLADLDLGVLQDIRQKLPALQNRIIV
jgi:nitrilase